MPEIVVRGIHVGEKEYVKKMIPVTLMASGVEMVLPVHILNGARPGPKLMLTALSHGDATTGFEVIRRFIESLDLEKLSGAIIAMPCQNPVAFEWDSRNTPIDQSNMNRTYPGNERGWFSDQMAYAVAQFCEDADMLIDWHGGGYGDLINYVLINRAEGELGEKIRKMGFAYGLEYLYNGKPAGPAAAYAGTLTDYMIHLGKPAIVAEVGTGLNLPPELDIIPNSVRGVYNVMKLNGMYPGEIEVPDTQYMINERPLTRPKKGGMFYPEVGPEYINKSVPKGTLLATIRNPLTLEVVEQMFAPCDETVFLDMRVTMTKVHPGDYAYILGNKKNATRVDNR